MQDASQDITLSPQITQVMNQNKLLLKTKTHIYLQTKVYVWLAGSILGLTGDGRVASEFSKRQGTVTGFDKNKGASLQSVH